MYMYINSIHLCEGNQQSPNRGDDNDTNNDE